MAELEHELRRLAAHVAWPETPDVAGRLDLAPRRRLLRRRALLVALAAGLLALAVALAVPDARSSILRFLHLGGVTIERVSTLPAAEERPLAADLGAPVTPARAAAVLGRPFRLPEVKGSPQLRESNGTVSALLATPEPVLLTETAGVGLMKKLASIGTRVEQAPIAPGVEGLWISGAPHVFFGPDLPPRLARDVLLWE